MAKNGFFNPDFDIWQRGISFVGTPGTYTADRWFFVNNPPTNFFGNTCNATQDTNTPTIAFDSTNTSSNYSLKITTINTGSLGTNDVIAIQYYMEGWTWKFFAQQAVKLSFWAKTNNTGNYYLSFSNFDYTWVYQTQIAMASPGVWQHLTKTIAASPTTGHWDYTTGTGVIITILLGAGSNYLDNSVTLDTWTTVSPVLTPTFHLGQTDQVNLRFGGGDYFSLSQMQMSIKNYGVTFPCRPYPLELVDCKRFYNTIGKNTTNEAFGTGFTSSTNDAFILIPFPERMRQTPAVSYSSLTDFRIVEGSTFTPSTIVLLPHSDISTKMSLTTASAMVAGRGAMLQGDNTLNAQITMDAELPIRTQPPLTLAGYTVSGKSLTTLTTTLTAINPGDLIIAVVADSAPTSTATATCNGISMNIATSTTYGTNSRLYIFYLQITQVATSINVVSTFGSTVNSAAMIVFQVLGTATQLLDQVSANSGTSTTSTSNATGTTTQPLEFIIDATATNGPDTDTVGNWDSFTYVIPDQNIGTNGGADTDNTFLRTAYYVTGGTGSFYASVQSMTSRDYGAAIATFY